jgi:hypothetical protein
VLTVLEIEYALEIRAKYLVLQLVLNIWQARGGGYYKGRKYLPQGRIAAFRSRHFVTIVMGTAEIRTAPEFLRGYVVVSLSRSYRWGDSCAGGGREYSDLRSAGSQRAAEGMHGETVAHVGEGPSAPRP